MTMNGHPFALLPALHRRHVPPHVGCDFLPRVETIPRSLFLVHRVYSVASTRAARQTTALSLHRRMRLAGASSDCLLCVNGNRRSQCRRWAMFERLLGGLLVAAALVLQAGAL